MEPLNPIIFSLAEFHKQSKSNTMAKLTSAGKNQLAKKTENIIGEVLHLQFMTKKKGIDLSMSFQEINRKLERVKEVILSY